MINVASQMWSNMQAHTNHLAIALVLPTLTQLNFLLSRQNLYELLYILSQNEVRHDIKNKLDHVFSHFNKYKIYCMKFSLVVVVGNMKLHKTNIF